MKTHKALRQVSQVILAVLLPNVLGQGTDLPYDSGSTGVDGPLAFRSFLNPGRSYPAMAYDETRQEMVLFGGSSTLRDTWTFNGTNWVLKTTPNAPQGRDRHVMAYDAARGQVVLYGGIVVGGQTSSDTWVWNGTAWQQKSPAQSPPPLYQAAMVYDQARQQVVLFGGYDPTRGGINETWIWDGTTWTKAAPTTSPQGRSQHSMAYDAERQEIVMFGGNGYETWIWNGTNWRSANPVSRPLGVNEAAMAYDAVGKRVILYGGNSYEVGGIRAEVYAWDGTNWTQLNTTDTPPARYQHVMAYDAARQQIVLTAGSGGTETWVLKSNNDWDFWSANYAIFDMTAKADGVWNFTSINVPAGLTLYFKANTANTPVRWLATDNVNINGALNLNGQNGLNGGPVNQTTGNEAPGGPGGYPGGLGAIRFDQSGTYTGSPGQGPGGGAPGVGAADGWNNGQRNAQAGAYATAYGNAYIQPLLGGSGGGGGGSGTSDNGGNGGGGGGAILIASKKDITVNGAIYANGGAGGSYAGAGSGGAIRLVGDRVNGGGRLEANGGGAGRIRVEGYFRGLVGNSAPVASISAPVLNRPLDATSSLVIASVAGQNVAQPATGNITSPDVVFTAAGDVTVSVQGQNIPNNTPVRLRITTANGIISKPAQGDPAVTMNNGTATFTATVPAGLGTIQAFAEFTSTQ